MRTAAVNATALALLLAGAGLAWGQPGAASEPAKVPAAQEKAPPAKSKLEEMLAQALKDNPDIRVAAAKLGEAEAELNRVRLQVMQKVVTLYHSTEMARADVATAERTLVRMRQLGRAVSREELDAAEAALAAAKAKLAAVEAEVPYLTGKQPHTTAADSATLRGLMYLRGLQTAGAIPLDELARKAALEGARRPVQGPLADRIRKALDTPVSLRVTEGSVADVLRVLREKEPALNIKYVPRQGAGPKLTFELKDMPVGAALEYLLDSLTDYTIVIREYGLLLTVEDRAPPGAVSLHDFWKKGRSPAAAGAEKNPPPQDVEGVVKRVDASGLLTVSLGSDAGLAKGHTLEVFRLKPEAKYLGVVRVVDTQPKEAVCQPVGRLGGAPQPGDRVAPRIKDK
jgi:BMFP domain-containing protein YqiC